MPSSWTAADIPDLTGRTALVTGGTSGLGLEISRELARSGARVLLTARDPGRGATARASVQDTVPGAALDVVPLDLADLSSVRTAATIVGQAPLDLLVNNAGVMALPERRTVDGFELQLGTNHLGHFALTGLLLPALLARPGARVVTMSSAAHRVGRIDFDDLQSERRYRAWPAYGQSKLANLLFTLELDARARAAGVDLVAAAAHPGYAATELQRRGPELRGSPLRARVMAVLNAVVAQSAARGALPALYAATAPDVVSGEYFGPAGRGELRGGPARVGRSAAAADLAVAERLWTVSEELTGVRYDALGAPTRR